MTEPGFIRSPLLDALGFNAIFCLRAGGVSPPPFDSLNLADDTGDDARNAARNLDMLLRAAGFSDPPHRARQVHGKAVLPCAGKGRRHERQADILLSTDGSPVAVRVADCTPVLIADAGSAHCAAVHAGWRGTAKQAVMHAVHALTQAGGDPARMAASIGPCIGPCCFEIGEEAASRLQACVEDGERHIHWKDGRCFANLAAINAAQLRSVGLRAERIDRHDGPRLCTCCQEKDFFSYRRDGAASGRHLAIVAAKTAA